jgi:excisionase family DNA binding protein
MTSMDRHRRHDERWQSEMLDGLARIHTVLHDISDGVRELRQAIVQQRSPQKPASADVSEPRLMSVAGLAEHLGLSPSAVYALRASGHAPPVTKVGSRVFFQRTDVDAWLAGLRDDHGPATLRWSNTSLPGRIGSSTPRSSAPPPYCSGSNTEPRAASRFSGRVVCRVCRDDVLVNKDGRTRKHQPYFH